MARLLGFLSDPENKSPGMSGGSTPRKANDKCIVHMTPLHLQAKGFSLKE